jgi:hypothetical protein
MIVEKRAEITTLPLLSDWECLLTRSLVYSLRPSWHQTIPDAPAFLLGVASYVDATPSGRAYADQVEALRPVLMSTFAALYQRLAEVLTSYLQAPVAYEERLAPPGFHIFLSDPRFETLAAPVHADLQFERHLEMFEGVVDTEHPLSFTVPIALPRSGAGMNYLDAHVSDYRTQSRAELDAVAMSVAPHHHRYTIGHLAVHSGLFLHQIAPSRHLVPEDERITLQGHGLKSDGVWRLYW